MIDRTTKLRWRRRYRRSRRQVEDISQQAEDHLERHFFRRLSRLWEVRRFIMAWILLLVLLIGGLVVQTRNLSAYYQKSVPAPGGIYTEGILGSFTNANPLYATGAVDAAVAHLVFAGLFTFNNQNQLVGDLAEKFDVDDSGKLYTVHLKKGLTWHDGQPLSSADVAFTYHVIQNPDAQSPLASSWAGIKITAVDPLTVTFELPNALSAFSQSMTNGIVPQHLLDGIPMQQLRSVPFNSVRPIGSGPFMWQNIEVIGTTPETREERIALLPNANYHGGAPKLGGFIIRSFHDEDRLIKSFSRQELNGVAGLNSIPDKVKNDSDVHDYNIPLTSGVFVFFKTSHEILQDVKVRQALVRAANVSEIISNLGYPVIGLQEPLLASQIGFDKALRESQYSTAEANRLLDEAGWQKGSDGLRKKGNQTLSFKLYSQNTGEYTYVTKVLQKQWQAIGVDLQVFLEPATDMQAVLTSHSYDALLYGIALGSDPDVYAFWHSSQADLRAANRLNFSEYRSTTGDKSLEAGRTRTDNAIRAIKYKPFLEAWRTDAPALALYQPRFLYLTHGQLFNFNPVVMNSDIGRYADVQNWMIKQAKVYK